MGGRRVQGIAWADRRLLVEAALLVVIIRAGLAVVTLRTLRRCLAVLGRRPRATGPRASADRIGWAVTAAGDRIPGTTCLARALAADVLLRRRRLPGRLRIAIARRGPRGLDGHAWVESDGQVVVGAAELEHHVALARVGPEPECR